MTERLVLVARTQLPWQAALMQNILRGHGIGCVLSNEHTAALGVHYALFSGGVEVMVPEDQLEAAQRVLAQAQAHVEGEGEGETDADAVDDWAANDQAGASTGETAPPDPPATCPNCGRGDIAMVHEPGLPRVLRAWLRPFLGPRRPAWYCRACDWYWKG
ncbi:MAG: DUF2007 domain-containing protein [Candidatus Hydrogenedentota bacterium]